MTSQTIAKTAGLVIVLGFVCVLLFGVRKGANVRKCRFEHIQLYILENVGLNAFLECFEISRFGCLFKPLQKRTVRWAFWTPFWVLLGHD